MPTRRQILGAMAVLPLAGVTFPSWAAPGGGERLVVVILRGGLDGLSAVQPHADPDFARVRGPLALGAPDGLLDLDGTFGLHPSLARLHGLYRKGEAAVLHATTTPYRDRSHFSGQDTLENGTTSATGARDGWLARALPMVRPGSDAIAVSESVPYLLRGAKRVASWAPASRRPVDEDTMARLTLLYAEDPLFAGALDEALQADALSGKPGRAKTDGPPPDRFSVLMDSAARFLAKPDGPRVAVVNMGGWDTHTNQNARLTRLLGSLDSGLDTLCTTLGDAWRRTAVLVVTEFGRTVAINGTKGTDHGTGGIALLAGGAIKGGRVIADWPGLAQASLLDGRDLRPTLDLRAAAKGLLHDHLRIATSALDTTVFPESGGVRPLQGLIRA
jgi:uncharacterized protein (DUF1501 family)